MSRLKTPLEREIVQALGDMHDPRLKDLLVSFHKELQQKPQFRFVCNNFAKTLKQLARENRIDVQQANIFVNAINKVTDAYAFHRSFMPPFSEFIASYFQELSQDVLNAQSFISTAQRQGMVSEESRHVFEQATEQLGKQLEATWQSKLSQELPVAQRVKKPSVLPPKKPEPAVQPAKDPAYMLKHVYQKKPADLSISQKEESDLQRLYNQLLDDMRPKRHLSERDYQKLKLKKIQKEKTANERTTQFAHSRANLTRLMSNMSFLVEPQSHTPIPALHLTAFGEYSTHCVENLSGDEFLQVQDKFLRLRRLVLIYRVRVNQQQLYFISKIKRLKNQDTAFKEHAASLQLLQTQLVDTLQILRIAGQRAKFAVFQARQRPVQPQTGPAQSIALLYSMVYKLQIQLSRHKMLSVRQKLLTDRLQQKNELCARLKHKLEILSGLQLSMSFLVSREENGELEPKIEELRFDDL